MSQAIGTVERRIVIVGEDLMFNIQVLDWAKRYGLTCIAVKSKEATLQSAQGGTVGILLDLTFAAVDPLDLIKTLKSAEETRAIPMLAYVPHVQTAVRQAAEEAGCDYVIPRSAFASRVPAVLEEWCRA